MPAWACFPWVKSMVPNGLEAACSRHFLRQLLHTGSIKNILANNQDKVAAQVTGTGYIPEHENLRGKDAYIN